MPKPILRTDVLEMKDLKPGMILKGTVRNVIDFGAFVDIGVHQDGLVHISQMTDRYIKHPLEAVSVGAVSYTHLERWKRQPLKKQPRRPAASSAGFVSNKSRVETRRKLCLL